MLAPSLDHYFRSFLGEEMHLLYTGDFSDLLTDRLIELNNHQYHTSDKLKVSQRKAAFLIAECFQNIVRHNDYSNNDSYFHIKNNGGLFSIISGNSIKNEVIPTLKTQLEQLNLLTSEELKEMYRKTLFDGKVTEKGGAGLGLIEMARRTKNKLSFSFVDIDEIRSYFYLQLLLQAANHAEKLNVDNFNKSIELRNSMLKDQLFLVYKGVMSTPACIALLGMVEESFVSVRQKVAFVKLMGFAERINSMKNSAEEINNGMLFMGQDGSSYQIGINCLLKQQEAMSIIRTLKLYDGLALEELDARYNTLLAESHQVNNKLHLELIDLLRNSAKIDVNYQSYTEEVAVLSLILNFKKRINYVAPKPAKHDTHREAELLDLLQQGN